MIRKLFLIGFLSVVLCIEISDIELTLEFNDFIEKFQREYFTVEETIKRYRIFSDNYKYIKDHNSKGYNFQLGINQFADLTMEEIKEMFPNSISDVNVTTSTVNTDIKIKDPIDWTNETGSIRNQESCPSAWAMVIAGTIDSRSAIKLKTDFVEASVQQMIDCIIYITKCESFDVTKGFSYVINTGLTTELIYPYRGRKGSCQKIIPKFFIGKQGYIKHIKVDELLRELQNGPVAAKVRANNKQFLHYKSGLLDWGCGDDNEEPNYDVLIVGTVKNATMNSWIIKNSWGKYWGHEGYAHIERKDDAKKDGRCGILAYISYPIIS